MDIDSAFFKIKCYGHRSGIFQNKMFGNEWT